MGSVELSALGDEVTALVAEHFQDVERAAEDDVRASAKVALEAVVSGSPTLTGKYGKGWAMEPDAEDASANAYRIYNRSKPGLTHLLEKGYGGPAPAPAYPHIAPAAQVGIAELERRIHA